MNKNHLLFFLMLLFAFNVGVAQEAPDLEDAKRLLQTWLEAQKDYEQLPGIAVAVVNDQDLLWKEGFGLADVEQKILPKPTPFTASARFLNCLPLSPSCN
jgi:CubicO group peptidase (beta-lactamase class C family)